MARASVSTLAAATLVLVALATVAVAAVRVSREGSAQLAGYLQDLYRVYSASIEARVVEDGVVVTSSTPLRLMAAYLVESGELMKVGGEVYVEGSTTIGDASLISRLRAGGRLLLVFEGGRYLVLDPWGGSEGTTSPANDDRESISRLYPLLAVYLKPEDYVAVTERYLPVSVSTYTLRGYYHAYPFFVYVRVTWNSTHYNIAYYRVRTRVPEGLPDFEVAYYGGGEDYLVIASMSTRIPSSGSQIAVPYGEWLYDRDCTEVNGIRYCFEVYVVARGWCFSRCSSPRDSLWYFAVGMRVVYRFEPVEPGYWVLAVLNRTTYSATVGRGVATCTSYTSYGGGCVTCSTSPSVGYCSVDTGTVLNVLGGPRPVFWWSAGYPQDLEGTYGDDGYEEGAWYPRTSVPSFSTSAHYAYALGDSITVAFYKEGVRAQDYLRQFSSYQDGYYSVSFKLVFDEGGLSYDRRVWDYRVVVFLMKPKG